MNNQRPGESRHSLRECRRSAHDMNDVASVDELQNRAPSRISCQLDFGPDGADVIDCEFLGHVAFNKWPSPGLRLVQEDARRVTA